MREDDLKRLQKMADEIKMYVTTEDITTAVELCGKLSEGLIDYAEDWEDEIARDARVEFEVDREQEKERQNEGGLQ